MTPFPEQDPNKPFSEQIAPDTISSSSPLSSELPDDKMINEGYKKDPGNIWAWVFIVTAVSALIWGTLSQYANYMQDAVGPHPFLQVTNREMSRFLWQNPEFMRANVRMKTGYLPAFAVGEGMRLDPSLADEWAVVSPEVLFRYHTWQRLIGDTWFPRPIPAERFMTFLEASPQWNPHYWKAAPTQYTEFLASLDRNSTLDLSALQLSTLPQEVRVAFQGWQNFEYEGKAIESMQPTYKEVKEFIGAYPDYKRPFWQNIVDNSHGRYLGSLATHGADETVVPREELAPFLRVALFNVQESARAKKGM